LHESQHAFQKGRSTETALHNVVSMAEKAISDKEYMLSTFLDIEGAFDNVSFNAINSRIYECDISSYVKSWIRFMLAHRTICFINQGERVTITATKGTPQGGVLSPLLWIIVINTLITRLSEHGFAVNGYADDVNINCVGKHISTFTERMQFALNILENWCSEVGLKVNPTKSELIIFTNKRSFEGYKNPTLCGQEIARKNEVKYLGLILDAKLNWKSHIEKKINKCLRIFWSCRSAIGKNWGLSPKCIMWIYTAIVRPTLAYGAFLWWQGTRNASIRMKLNHLQRVASLSVTGAMSTTPQKALDVILGLPRLEDFIEAEAMKTAFRLKPETNPYLKNSHVDSLSNILKLDNLRGCPTDRLCRPIYQFDRLFNTQAVENLEEFIAIHEWADASYFTDASVKPNGSGMAIFDECTNYTSVYSMGTTATIKQLEITAISYCATTIIENGIQGNLAIFTDSLAAIKALECCEINSKVVLDCFNNLQTVALTNRLKIVWIRAHSNIRGNDLADARAKEAANGSPIGPEPFLPIDYSRARDAVGKWLTNRCRLTWQGVFGCEHTKKFLVNYNLKFTKQVLNLSKSNLRTVTGLITGHAKVNYHLRKMGIRDDPDCRLCGRDVETAAHLICECDVLADIRLAKMGKITILPNEVDNVCNITNFFRDACTQYPCLNAIFGATH